MRAEVLSGPTLFWFRRDLRLADHPALLEALSRGHPVIPVFVFAPEEESPWAPGQASRWWLRESLRALDAALRERGSRLVVRKGPSLEVLGALVRETGATAVFWSHASEPAARARDAAMEAGLRAGGTSAEPRGGGLLFDPEVLRTHSGHPFRVFTPFWRACLKHPPPGAPLPPPSRLPAPRLWPASLDPDELDPPSSREAARLGESWRPGERGAEVALARFVAGALAAYPEARDRPAEAGTSRLSPHLHFGEVTARQVWAAVQEAQGHGAAAASGPVFLRQLGWRELAHHLLHHFPQTAEAPLRPEFAAFPWHRDAALLRAWQRGETGYPIVDAGMRELLETGWMHNRVRMIVASFLVKDLLQPWVDGARFFWERLVDADLANNTLGWQWTAGCGADAAPFFRVFNPAVQGEKFDPRGAYVRRFVPEISRLPDRWIHRPAEAPAAVLRQAGVRLGASYPAPVVDHRAARQRALSAWARIRR